MASHSTDFQAALFASIFLSLEAFGLYVQKGLGSNFADVFLVLIQNTL